MSPKDNLTPTVIQTTALPNLEIPLLIDLLEHKTKLLIAARRAGITDPVYLEKLACEVEEIQMELKKRTP